MRLSWPTVVLSPEAIIAIECAVILCNSDRIGPTDLALTCQEPPPQPPNPDLTRLDDYFRDFVQKHQTHMTETDLARALGISRKTLWERRSRMKLPRERGGGGLGEI